MFFRLRTLIVALLLVLAAVPSMAAQKKSASFNPPPPEGFHVAWSVPLTKQVHGIDGVLQVVEDARITPDLRKIMWAVQPEVAYLLPETDPRRQDFIAKPQLSAHLRLVQADGAQKLDQTLPMPLALLEGPPAALTNQKLVLLTTDDGNGVYVGRTTMFVSIENGNVSLISLMGNPGPLGLTQSFRKGWRFTPGKKDEIQVVQSQPTPAGDGTFTVGYSTIRIDGGKWLANTHNEPGLWEAKQPFPDSAKFP